MNDPRKNIDFFHQVRDMLDKSPETREFLSRPWDKEASRRAEEEQRIIGYTIRLRTVSNNADGIARLIATLKELDWDTLWDMAYHHVVLGADPGRVAEAMLLMHGNPLENDMGWERKRIMEHWDMTPKEVECVLELIEWLRKDAEEDELRRVGFSDRTARQLSATIRTLARQAGIELAKKEADGEV